MSQNPRHQAPRPCPSALMEEAPTAPGMGPRCAVRGRPGLSAPPDPLSGAWRNCPSLAHTRGRGGWSRRRGKGSEGTRALAGTRHTAEAPRAAPPLRGPGIVGRRHRFPTRLTHLRVQRHQLHERPGLLELSERHRAAAGPLALLRRPWPRRLRGPGSPTLSPCAPTPRPSRSGRAVRAAAAAALALRLLRHPAPPRPLATCARGGAEEAPPPGRHSRRGPPPRPCGARWPRLHCEPLPGAPLRLEEAFWLLPPKPSHRPPNPPQASIPHPALAPPGPRLSLRLTLFRISRRSLALQGDSLLFPTPPLPTHTHTESPGPDPGRSWKGAWAQVP